MAPSESTLETALIKSVRDICKSVQRENLSVRLIRNTVESDLELDDGFFLQGDWKAKSKQIIQDETAKLLDEEENPPSAVEAESPVKSSPVTKKRGRKSIGNGKPPAKKRQKKEATLSEKSDEAQDSDASVAKPKKRARTQRQSAAKPQKKKTISSESENSDLDVEKSSGSDEYNSESAKPKKNAKSKGPPRRHLKQKQKSTKKVESGDEDEASEEDKSKSEDSDSGVAPKKGRKSSKETPVKTTPAEPAKYTPVKSTSVDSTPVKPPKSRSRSKSQLVDSEDEEPVKTNERSSGPASTEPSTLTLKTENPEKSDPKAHESSSESSVILDGPPPKQRKKRHPKSESKSETKPKSKTKSTSDKSALSEQEAEIKTLQSQLVSCGVRKIWQFELKKYGDDERAKIRHLKDMLKEIGMTGRYSKAKATEIKERRELMADVQAVTDGDKVWGLVDEKERPKRGRSQQKQKKVVGSDDEDEEDDDGGEEDEEKEDPEVKKRKAKQDLAFLGDEEDSD